MGLPGEDLSTVEDFLGNDAFRSWMTERNAEDQAIWQAWLALHPEKREVYEEAVATFFVLQGKTVAVSEEQVKARTEQIMSHLSNSPGGFRLPFRVQWGRWASAAAVIGLLIGWQLDAFILPGTETNKNSKSQVVQVTSWQLVKNEGNESSVMNLPDQSSVVLSPGSQLRFRKQMNTAVREVFLEGEGFFEVTKNPARPFVVYTANLTTKVLGTSFQVRSFAGESTAFVKVKTGKVTVSPVKSPDKSILLTVNQVLRLGAKTQPLVTRERLSAEAPATAPIAQPFTFSYTPVSDILDQLEASYHMPIRYNRDVLKNCTFTGQLNDVPFLEKIRLVCLTIESTYEVVNNQVVIHSQGCN